MLDAIFFLATLAFFAISIAYVSGCDQLWIGSGPAMTFEYAAGIVLSILLTVYLGYALVRPERF
jgi:K+-transporting ATPase KdpF subunit